jgi:hypothetical protein
MSFDRAAFLGAHESGQIAVELWRGKLWCGALALQGVDDHEVGMRLQSCYRAERTRRFRLTEQVQAITITNLWSVIINTTPLYFQTLLYSQTSITDTPSIATNPYR